MRLADFILANIEPILAEWETFARSIWPGPATDPATLRDHAADILRATARDMKTGQSASEQSDKSKGEGEGSHNSDRVDSASDVHAIGRVGSGFDLLLVVAEYRALRASVIRLWQADLARPDHHDLADLTRFNESIDRSRQMFLAILGHDLRNPLQSIGLLAHALARTSGLDAESLQMAHQVSASAAAMFRMINDLLDFTRAGLNAAMPLSPAAMDLEKLCREVVEEMRSAHPGRTLRLECHGELTGEWDASRLRQVISNLLGNALQHGAQGGAVEIAVSGEASAVRIEVRNQGTPIPPEALPTIFDPLVRIVPQEQKHRQAGSIGLGLYIAREVVSAHRGTINVRSSAQEGTLFTVRLPRSRPTV